MVSLRKRLLRKPTPPAASDGTDARISELEPMMVRNTKDQVRSDRSLGQSSLDHESEKNNGRRSVDLVAPAISVSESMRRTPLDHVEPRVMTISSILARSSQAEVWVCLDLNQKPSNVSMDSQLQVGLGGHSIAALPAIKRHGARDAIPHKNEGTGFDNSARSEEGDAPEVMSSEETSDRFLEARYVDRRESPSVSSRRRAGRAAGKRGKSIALPECQVVDSSNQRKKYNTRSVQNVERSAPSAGSSGHYLRSSTVRNDPVDEGKEAPEERSLEHAVKCLVLVCGGDGISQEDVLVSLHEQLPPAMLAHTDWEADTKQYLKSRLFAQVQDQFVLRKHSSQIHGPSSSKRKETSSQSSGESGLKGLPSRKFKRNEVQGGVSMSNIIDHGLGKRGSLKALQQKIEEEEGISQEARRCALTSAPTGRNLTSWQCPLMAMEDKKLSPSLQECRSQEDASKSC